MATFKKDTRLHPQQIEVPPNFPSISKPEIVGYFSVDKNRQYVADLSQCKFIAHTDPNGSVRFDLNHGYTNVIHKNENLNEKLEHLLQFIKQNIPLLRNPVENSRKLLAVDVVCFRGLLRALMCMPYENREPMIVLATNYRGTIYLCAQETEKRRMERMSQSEMQTRIMSYGFKFEQYMMSGKFDEEPNISEPVNENEEFCCMFRTKVEGNTILYGAEMDGIDSDGDIDLSQADFNQLPFIELKVKLREERENQRRNYLKFKLRNWWCQCFLVNIKKIIVGTRNNNGIVNQLSELDVRSIPKQVNVNMQNLKKSVEK